MAAILKFHEIHYNKWIKNIVINLLQISTQFWHFLYINSRQNFTLITIKNKTKASFQFFRVVTNKSPRTTWHSESELNIAGDLLCSLHCVVSDHIASKWSLLFPLWDQGLETRMHSRVHFSQVSRDPSPKVSVSRPQCNFITLSKQLSTQTNTNTRTPSPWNLCSKWPIPSPFEHHDFEQHPLIAASTVRASEKCLIKRLAENAILLFCQ